MLKKRNILILLMVFIMISSFSVNVLANNLNITIGEDGLINIHGNKDKDAIPVWNELIKKYKTFIIGFSAIGALTSLLFFMKAFIALGSSSGIQKERNKAIQGLLWTGISTMLLGATGLITSIFYGLF